MRRKQIIVFDENNEFLTVYGELDQFERPLDVAVFESRVYVVDMNRNKILVLDKDSGQTIQEIGGPGGGEGEFFKPSFITVDNDGNLYVTDSFNFRVQVFDKKGEFLRVIGFHGDVSGAFSRPKGLAIDRNKNLYVADAAFENVQIFDGNDGTLLLWFGGATGLPGGMHLPASVHIDYDNVEYFQKYADKNFKVEYILLIGNLIGAKRLSVYGFGKWVGPPLPKQGK
jgi:DNA-binding beta-propeller fold protein YncE